MQLYAIFWYTRSKITPFYPLGCVTGKLLSRIPKGNTDILLVINRSVVTPISPWKVNTDFLLVINSNFRSILYRFWVMRDFARFFGEPEVT